jgi:hypothetical protein
MKYSDYIYAGIAISFASLIFYLISHLVIFFIACVLGAALILYGGFTGLALYESKYFVIGLIIAFAATTIKMLLR